MVIQTRTTFGSHADNVVVRYRVLPYYIEAKYPLASCCLSHIHSDLRFMRIRRRIRITQSRHNVGQSFMLPANQDISWASIIVHDVRNAGGVVSLARGVYGHIPASRQWLDGIVWPLLFAVFLGFLCHDMANVVMRFGTEDVDQALRPLQSLRVQTTAADWLFAMAYQVHGGSSIGQSNKTQEEKASKEYIGFTTNAKAQDHFQKTAGVALTLSDSGSPTIFIWLPTF